MKTRLDHLPDSERRELARVVEIPFAELEDARMVRNTPAARPGRALKILLFGSFARARWIDDPEGGDKSDDDLLALVKQDELTGLAEYWSPADDHLLRELQVAHPLTTCLGRLDARP